ncbi:MAG TPA: restriction endonuclease subunit S [Verrucomicrobiae bacterium]
MKKGWQRKRLDEVCEISMGQSPDGDSYNTTGEGVPLINGPVEFSDESFGETIRSKFTTEPTKFCKRGDLILCVRGSTTGRMNIAGFDACIGRGVAAIRAKEYQPWINHFINSKRDEIHGKGTGATFPNVSGATLAGFELIMPPIDEQRRIVGVLDEAFAGLATAKANTEKNLQNARAIFESHLQSVFTQRGKGWVQSKLDDVCGFQNGFAFKSNTFKPSGVPILRISNIQDGRVDTDNRLVFFDPKDYKENLDRYRVVENDLLIAMSGATTGKLGFNTQRTVSYLNQRVGKFEPGEKLNKRFLYHFLSTKVEENLRISAGAAQPNLSTEQIKGFMLPLPAIDEQTRIVETFETLQSKTQRLESIYQQKLAALEALKKSLLHQAFEGKL